MIEEIMDTYPDEDFLVANGFDAAIVGVDSTSMRLIYSVTKCIDILMSEGMTDEEALEFFEYNVRGAYVGDRTPIWMDTPIEYISDYDAYATYHNIIKVLESHQDANMSSSEARHRIATEVIKIIT